MPSSWNAARGQLPATIDPIQLAERGARLTGALPLTGMSRLTQGDSKNTGHVDVDLTFEHGEGERVFVMRGVLRTQLRATCQRCLEEMDLTVVAEPWMILVRSGETRRASDDDADTLVVDRPLSLIGLVEDELLLALPMVPKHAPEHCPAGRSEARAPESAGKRAGTTRKNPFAVLGRWKRHT